MTSLSPPPRRCTAVAAAATRFLRLHGSRRHRTSSPGTRLHNRSGGTHHCCCCGFAWRLRRARGDGGETRIMRASVTPATSCIPSSSAISRRTGSGTSSSARCCANRTAISNFQRLMTGPTVEAATSPRTNDAQRVTSPASARIGHPEWPATGGSGYPSTLRVAVTTAPGTEIPSVGRILSAPGAIAQLGERLLCKQEVAGSIPAGSI